MNEPIPLYPDRQAHEPMEPATRTVADVSSTPEPSQDVQDAGERITPQERRYLAKRARESQRQRERASAPGGMSTLAESLRPWLDKRGLPPRCDMCGYSGVLGEEPTLTQDDKLVYTRIYCHCVWAEKARKRDKSERDAMIEAQRIQHADRLRKKLVLPSAYTNYTLATHPLAQYNPSLHSDILDWLSAWDLRRGLMLRGPYGRGKTAYLVAIMQALLPRACNDGWDMLYTGGAELFQRLQDGFDDDTYARTRDEFSTVHLLAIDDLGASQQVTKWRQDQYLSIFEARYANDLPMFITTNLNDDELRAHLTERVYWRLVERCDLIDVNGPNLRDARDVAKWQKKGGK